MFSNKYIFKITLQAVLIVLIWSIYNIIRYNSDPFLIVRALYLVGIFSIIIFMVIFVAASVSGKIIIFIKSFKDVIFWSLIMTYYTWSLSALIYDNILRSTFDEYWNVWNVIWMLFVVWFLPLFGMFYLLYRRTKS